MTSLDQVDDFGPPDNTLRLNGSEPESPEKPLIFTAVFLFSSTIYFCLAFLNCVYSDRSPNIYENMIVFGGVQYDFAISLGEIWRFVTSPLINDSFASYFAVTILFFVVSRALERVAGWGLTATTFIVGGFAASAIGLLSPDWIGVQYSAAGGVAALFGTQLGCCEFFQDSSFFRRLSVRVIMGIIHVMLIACLLFSELRGIAIAHLVGVCAGFLICRTVRTREAHGKYSWLFGVVPVASIVVLLFGLCQVYVLHADVARGTSEFRHALEAFEMGSFAEADKRLADVKPVLGLDTEELALWRYVAQRRAGQPSAFDQLRIVTAGSKSGWEYPIVNILYWGVIANSPPDIVLKRGRYYAWYFFAGETLLLEGQNEKARAFFEFVRDNAPSSSVERQLANGELRRSRPVNSASRAL